jgi:hypothetical protein
MGYSVKLKNYLTGSTGLTGCYISGFPEESLNSIALSEEKTKSPSRRFSMPKSIPTFFIR